MKRITIFVFIDGCVLVISCDFLDFISSIVDGMDTVRLTIISFNVLIVGVVIFL